MSYFQKKEVMKFFNRFVSEDRRPPCCCGRSMFNSELPDPTLLDVGPLSADRLPPSDAGLPFKLETNGAELYAEKGKLVPNEAPDSDEAPEETPESPCVLPANIWRDSGPVDPTAEAPEDDDGADEDEDAGEEDNEPVVNGIETLSNVFESEIDTGESTLAEAKLPKVKQMPIKTSGRIFMNLQWNDPHKRMILRK